MPIWLRRFTFSKLKEHYEKQNEEAEKIKSQSKSKPSMPKGPNIKPSYTSKASTK